MPQVQLGEQVIEGTASPLLQVKDLTVTFKKIHGTIRRIETTINAVDCVSFSMNKGDILAIVGESGSGKTTLAKCIMKTIRPNSGSITFNGKEITNLEGDELLQYRRSVQMIYQDPFESLTPRHDVHTILSIPLVKLLGMKDRRAITDNVRRLLQEVGLDPEVTIHRYPHQLSGGQRQRVNIARALAPNPELLVADEPVTMLDAAQKLKVLQLLSQLAEKRNLSVILITHDLASARLLTKTTTVMYLGKIVEQGETQTILAKPKHPYVELILSATPSLKKSRSYSGGSRTWIEDSERVKAGCVFRPRCKYSTAVCEAEEPKLLEKSKGHLAACHNPLN